MRVSTRLLFTVLICGLAVPAFAQSPNTASIVVVVVDQTDGVVNDAKVTVTNTETGASRDAVSGSEGSASFAALPLTGQYTISVSKQGFTAEDVSGVMLRATETATVKVKLVASGGKSEVMVYGTTQGMRADAQIGKRLDSATIDETPILGRKLSSLPLLNSAFRQAKGTGDLFVNATYFVTGVGGRRQPPDDDVHAGRLEQRRGLGSADDVDHGPGGRRSGGHRALERVLGGVRLDIGSRDEHRHQVRHECATR